MHLPDQISPMFAKTMIECENLTKRFGQFGAVSFGLVDGKQ
jgi:hypothetical protein